jgi:hypothetical protein
MQYASGYRADAAQGRDRVRDETYTSIIEHAKAQARRYAALGTREGRTAAVAVLRFARSLRARRAAGR